MRDGKKLEWLEEKFGKKKEADKWIVILQHLEVVLFAFLFYFLSFTIPYRFSSPKNILDQFYPKRPLNLQFIIANDHKEIKGKR